MPRRTWALLLLSTLLGMIALLSPRAASAQHSAGSLRIGFVGDTHGYGSVEGPLASSADLLAAARPLLEKSDLFVFNHEGTLIAPQDEAGNCRAYTNQSTFATPPEFAQRLEPGVPAVAALGNNHAMDCGPVGLKRTLAEFAAAGIATVGAGQNLEQACRPLELMVKGTRVVFVSYLYQDAASLAQDSPATATTAGVATYDGCDPEATIAAMPADDLVIALIHAHWGSSWRYGVSGQQLAAVHELLGWGADLVVASGPHFLQGVLAEPEGMALLGLGDFMFDRGSVAFEPALYSFFALVEFERARPARALVYPFELDGDGLPSKPPVRYANLYLGVTRNLSHDLGTTFVGLDGIGLLLPYGATTEGVGRR
jgi:poly-gamma-glutamate synthesis protein (capsule biosynthesis protein)